ncbi:MAG: hypothetical protein AAFZ58_06105 [Pseudomonadota bacterium]
MKSTMFRAAALAVVLCLAACGRGPADTAEAFMTHINDGKISEAKGLATESTGELLDLVSGLGGLEIDPDFKFRLVDEEIDGNRATITFENAADGKKDTISLVKVDGAWKVHAEKR